MPGFADEIPQQPAALRLTLDSIAPHLGDLAAWRTKVADGKLRRVIISGMGASHFSNLPAQLYMIQQGVETFAIEASELLHYQLPLVTPDTLLILVSQSGRSVETIKLLDALNGRAPTIAITNGADSPLAQRADLTLLMQAGDEKTVSSKTYTCTLALQHILSRALVGQDAEAARMAIYPVADAMEAALPAWQAQASELVARIDGSQTIMYLGRGASQASAMTGALITKESTKYPTEGMNAGQFRHGPMEIVDERIAAYIFAGGERTRAINVGLGQEMARLGGRVMIVGAGEDVAGATMVRIPTVDDWLLPIVEIVPIHCFAAKFAAHRGYTPGDFRYLEKVTTRE
ncbi:MAG: SIS domain-containing protein [Chloroflexota bacterium]|nr:SIS domain-containing protein [Chloroflexota bacterium]